MEFHHEAFVIGLWCRKFEPFMAQHQFVIGRDAFFDLLSERNLLVSRRKRRKPITTFSDHWMRKFPNFQFPISFLFHIFGCGIKRLIIFL